MLRNCVQLQFFIYTRLKNTDRCVFTASFVACQTPSYPFVGLPSIQRRKKKKTPHSSAGYSPSPPHLAPPPHLAAVLPFSTRRDGAASESSISQPTRSPESSPAPARACSSTSTSPATRSSGPSLPASPPRSLSSAPSTSPPTPSGSRSPRRSPSMRASSPSLEFYRNALFGAMPPRIVADLDASGFLLLDLSHNHFSGDIPPG